MQLIKYDACKTYEYNVYTFALDGSLVPVCDIHGKPQSFYSFQAAANCIRMCKDVDNDHGFNNDYFIAIYMRRWWQWTETIKQGP